MQALTPAVCIPPDGRGEIADAFRLLPIMKTSIQIANPTRLQSTPPLPLFFLAALFFALDPPMLLGHPLQALALRYGGNGMKEASHAVFHALPLAIRPAPPVEPAVG
jgi:hypothetical protein